MSRPFDRAASAAGALLLAVALLTGGCASRRGPDLHRIYDRSAQTGDLHRNPVVLVPGLMGSRLASTVDDRIVWGAFGGRNANPNRPAGAQALALPMREGVPLARLTDEIVATSVLDRVRVRLLGLPLQLGAYIDILEALGIGGYRDEELGLSGAVDYGDSHFTCFQFPYDWRRSVAENAQRLDAFLEEKRRYVEEELERQYGVEDPEVRFDLVAHSLGGLVTRYYLRYGGAGLPEDGSAPELTWAGAERVERAILVGTPNAGSAETLLNMVRGLKIAPTLPRYSAALIGTMASAYELLPRGRHGPLLRDADPDSSVEDLLDPELWIEQGWGLADPDQADQLALLLPDVEDPARRREIAVDHLRKNLAQARRVQQALDRPATRPEGLTLSLIAGDARSTLARAGLGPAGDLKELEWGPGDGKVLRSSALMDERRPGAPQPRLISPVPWSDVLFLFRDHTGLTRDPAFVDNVLYRLLEATANGNAPR